MQKTERGGLLGFFERYSLIIAAVVIYGYYLLTSLDLFKQSEAKRTFLDYVFQFDSVIYLWIIAAVSLQLQKHRRQQREQEQRLPMLYEFERQRIHLQELNEIVSLLQENVYGPLATISISSHTIRQRLPGDRELVGMLDRIDTSLQRINSAINDIKAQQVHKVMQESVKQRQGAKSLNAVQPLSASPPGSF